MKKLFKAIRQENLEEVKSIIEKNPQLVNCVATPPPKKDNGQSPLQVALKISAFEKIMASLCYKNDEEEWFFSLYVIPYFSQTWAAEYLPDRKSSHARILSSVETFGLDIKIPPK